MKIYTFIIYILRYFSLITADYKLSKKINFVSKISNNFFLNNLKHSKFYLEFGSGVSSLMQKIKKKIYYFRVR